MSIIARALSINILVIFVICGLSQMAWSAPNFVREPEVQVVISGSNHGETDIETCVVRFDLTGASRSYRRQQIINFLRKSYIDTRKWKRSFIAGGVDYVAFQHIYIFAPSSCSTEVSLIKSIAALISPDCTRNTALIGCDRDLRVITNEEKSSWWVGRLPEGANPLLRFEALYGKDSVGQCLLSFSAYPSVTFSDIDKLKNILFKAVPLYRLPFADFSQIDRTFYILFSRDCGDREKILSEWQTILKQDGLIWPKYFTSPDFSPDRTKYLKFELGD